MKVFQKGLKMNDEALQKRDQVAAIYLQEMQALAFEITVAMDAIASNTLSKFQESVARQEMLCASLALKANAVSEGVHSSEESLLSGLDPAVGLKIRAAGKAIRALNQQYAALLAHSGKTIALLALLCRSHSGRIQEARGPRLKHQTWSCEM
jgi:hypothetical protein